MQNKTNAKKINKYIKILKKKNKNIDWITTDLKKKLVERVMVGIWRVVKLLEKNVN